MISLKLTKSKKDNAPIQKVRKKNIEVIEPFQYHFYVSKSKLVIINSSNNSVALFVNRNNCQSQFINNEQLKQIKAKQAEGEPKKYFAIFGQIIIKNVEFLILVQKACVAGDIFKKKIYEVLSVEFFVINQNKYEQKMHEKCYDHLLKVKHYLKSGFYFSYDYPLHLNFKGNEIFQMPVTHLMSKNIFVWNYKALKSLLPEVSESNYFVPFIQGYVGHIKTLKGDFLLISRRSFIMGGTRYNARGIDNNGFVANFVESEQIFWNTFRLYSYIQYRGSLPFYWEQKGVKAKIKVHQKLDVNINRFEKHMKMMNERFNMQKVIFFNLLGVNRGDEDVLTRYLLQILENSEEKKNTAYFHCDFHAITKETDFSAVDNYIRNIAKIDQDMNVFQIKQNSQFNRLKKQITTVRTNCMDCLDRTNAVQTKISFWFFYLALKNLEIDIFDDGLFKVDPLVYLEKSTNVYMDDFRKMWADNGDSISLIYAGTGATTSSVTRKGEKSGLTSFFDHGIKTISRFYLNNFDDSFKQEIIDELLNKKQSTIRQSLLNFDNQDVQKFQIGIISLFSCKQNEMLEIELDLLKNMFIQMNECESFVFLFYTHKNNNIKIKAKDYLVYSNFHEIFKTFSPIMQNFEIYQSLEQKQFEIFLFKQKNQSDVYSFYKQKKISANFWKKQLGFKISIIINDHQIEFFALNIELMKKDNDVLVKLLNKYVDQYYDMIFILGNFQEEINLNDIHPQFEHLFGNSIIFKKDQNLVNQLNLLCSKKLISNNLEPMEKAVMLNTEGMSSDFILNSRIFVLFDPKKNQLNKVYKFFKILQNFFLILLTFLQSLNFQIMKFRIFFELFLLVFQFQFFFINFFRQFFLNNLFFLQFFLFQNHPANRI